MRKSLSNKLASLFIVLVSEGFALHSGAPTSAASGIIISLSLIFSETATLFLTSDFQKVNMGSSTRHLLLSIISQGAKEPKIGRPLISDELHQTLNGKHESQ